MYIGTLKLQKVPILHKLELHSSIEEKAPLIMMKPPPLCHVDTSPVGFPCRTSNVGSHQDHPVIDKMASVSLEEYDLLGDSKYRSYVTAVDKALKNFEYTSEWADLISALGKLNKVLSAHMRYPVIPKRITISKRLAQCMHHALPAGVHLKAIETYDIIFKCIGTNRLSQELFIYSAGLFPLLGQAAMNVKPALLTIYETHFVPLRERLRPGLHGFLVGVLPALEETSESFQRTSELLEQICEGTNPTFFYGSLWDCVVANPGVRLTAIDFALNHFNRKLSMEDQLYMIGTDIDTMVRAFCVSVLDSNILVQRSTLDLLQLCFPMHNSQLLKPDMSKIVTSSILVILRRDMSLNRRLFGWLLGYDCHPPIMQQISVTSTSSEKLVNEIEQESTTNKSDNNYFTTYSRDLLIYAMINCLKREVLTLETTNLPNLWCYRLLQNLLDKPDIAKSLLNDVLIQVFRALYFDYNNSKKQESSRSSKQSSELLKAANIFFSTLEPDYIWSYICSLFIFSGKEAADEYKLLEESGRTRESNLEVLPIGSKSHSLSELCLIVNFLLDVLTLETYVDAPSNHLSEFLKVICVVLTNNIHVLTPQEFTVSLSLCSKILSKIQPIIDPVLDVKSKIDDNDKSVASIEIDVETDPGKRSQKINTKHSERLSNESNETDLDDSVKPELMYDKQRNPVIQQCIITFLEFFQKFFEARVFVDSLEHVLLRFSELTISDDTNLKDNQKVLESLLWKCLGVHLTINKSPKSPQKYFPTNTNTIETVPNIGDISEPFGYACQLLLELSSFPVYSQQSSKSSDLPLQKPESNMYLPNWLNLLLLCCCFVNDHDFHFISSATILDLISVTKGVMQDSQKEKQESAKKDSQTPSDVESVVSVKIAPVLSAEQLLYIETQTVFYNLAASKLWNFLGESTSEHHLKAVQLFVLLQNLSLDYPVCEDLLGLTMTQENDMKQVESMKKFSILWHLTRDMKSKLGASNQPTYFDRSLFVMLDNLEKPIGSQKAIAQTWLTHCIQMNDLSRILEPIYLMLLHPDSARVSIQHVHINRPQKVKVSSKCQTKTENDEAKIYAISSIEGNVIYHVGSDSSKPSSQIGSPERRILALTSILNPGDHSNKVGSSKVVTANSMLQEFESPSRHEQQLSQLPMSLYMNPFGSLLSIESDSGLESCSTQTDLCNAKRVDIAAALRKSSFDLEDDDSESARTQTPDSTCRDMSPVEIATSILDEIISVVTKSDDVTLTAEFSVGEDAILSLENQATDDENGINKENEIGKDVAIHPLHTHLLLYYQVYDSEKTLYALSTLKTILLSNSRAVLCSMTTTSICNMQSSRYMQLLSLLTRHKKSVFGKNFHGELQQTDITSYRSSMYIEIIILICLYYIRGYYPNNLTQMRLSVDDVTGNRNVQLMSTEVLTIVFSELMNIVKNSSKSLASYIAEVMTKCKLQKTVLHCLLASVYNASRRHKKSDQSSHLTDAIIDFNESIDIECEQDHRSDFSDTFQIQLLRLLLVVIILEDEVFVQKKVADPLSTKSNNPTSDNYKNHRSSRINFVSSSSSTKYKHNLHIPGQPMFLHAILCALKQHHNSALITHWMNLITLSLPYMGKSLSNIVSNSVNQICINLETKAELYCGKVNKTEAVNKNPADYMIILLDGLTSLCHYCILDNSSQVLTVNQPSSTSAPPSISHSTHIFSNLIHVFTNNDANKTAGNKETHQVDPVISARKSLLSALPRIISALASVWNYMKKAEKLYGDGQQHFCWIMGSPKAIKQQILGFVSPISLNHGINFFGAVSLIWDDQKTRGLTSCNWSEQQLVLVDLISSIKVMPIDTLVQNIRHVVKHPPPTNVDDKRLHKNLPLEVSILQFFSAYISVMPSSHLQDSWSSLAPLWKDGLQIAMPSVQFLLLGILNEYVQKTSLSEDKKEQKELQV
ncbi:Protein dopey-2 [Nymphon striatum]|nr:Protein dopey-2 [Nymphon striatum]